MYGVLIFLHLLVAVLLVLVVLIQQPQKGGLGTILGGGESIFGGGGAAPFMAKITSALAVAFMLTSLGLVLVGARRIKAGANRTSVKSDSEVVKVTQLEKKDVRSSENSRFSIPC
ncbi:preprotein translocase subunit SecG [candidate division WOR-3 bacterium]|nr:preprotein translocase subunit SecG [candidate division WOR-3 bacterium]